LRAESLLQYLEQTLSIVETVQPSQRELRFVLDPLAEYFAADFLLGADTTYFIPLKEFLAFVESSPKNLERCHGFAEALVRTAKQLDNVPSDFQSRLRDLEHLVIIGLVSPAGDSAQARTDAQEHH
jgi:hypothetical protein